MTLRRQVFSRLLILAGVTFLLGALATFLLLGPFSLMVQSKRSLDVAREIEADYPANRLDRSGNNLQWREGMLLTVVDASVRRGDALSADPPLPAEVADLSVPGDHFFHQGPIPGSDSPFLSLFYLLEPDAILIIASPLPLIRESITVALVFYLLQALVGLGVSILLAWRFSARFSAPVQALNRRALGISELRFDSPSVEPLNDELRSLDASLSLIAGRLRDHVRNLADQKQRDLDREMERRNFLAGISHELRTPVSVILGHAEGLEDGIPKTDAERDSYLRAIAEESRKMGRIIEDILDLTRMENGVVQLKESCFPVGEVMAWALRRVDQEFPGRRIESPPDQAKVQVRADRVRTEQIVWNYLHNALRHGEEPIRLRVETRDLQIRIWVDNEDHSLQPGDLPGLWKRFTRKDSVRPSSAGTGLGLAMVSAICRQAGYGYGCSKTGTRLMFWLDLPGA